MLDVVLLSGCTEQNSFVGSWEREMGQENDFKETWIFYGNKIVEWVETSEEDEETTTRHWEVNNSELCIFDIDHPDSKICYITEFFNNGMSLNLIDENENTITLNKI